MEQLISMRQRIKAIETIKKITHAMRLISMSTRAKLRNKKNNLDNYKQEFDKIFTKVKPILIRPITEDSNKQKMEKNLIILIGSQKGLCGTFNSSLFKFIEANYQFDKRDHFITVGKYATDYLKSKKQQILEQYNNFRISNFVSIAQSLSSFIFRNFIIYSKTIVFSNYPRTFFTQEPKKLFLYINDFYPIKDQNQRITTDYIFEQSREELTDTIMQLGLFIKIQELLFDSLLAEQSARFLSMDAATRNAENLSNTMRLEYNKLRQANITRELTELITSY